MELRIASRSVLALLAILFSSASQAQLFRAYLSVDGSDGNPCTIQQPCRLLPAALNAVTDGGEVWILDSANYNTGPVTIGKSATVLAVPGAVGSFVALGGPAITITASSLKIALRNLVIVPFPGAGGTDGIHMTGVSTLTIENSLIANLPNDAVRVTGAGTVEIHNTIIRNNGGYAVRLAIGASANISGTKMLNNSFGGVSAQSGTATTAMATVSDSVISGGSAGVYAITSVVGAVARIFVTRCTIQDVTSALYGESGGGGSALVAVSYSMIANNNYAWRQLGAGTIIRTLGNNHIADNTTFAGSLTSESLQ